MSKRPRIETLLRRFRSSRRPTTGPLTLHRRRLLTEPLEDRRMLSVVTVNNNLDLVNGDTSSIANLIATDGGDGISLREALDAANNTAGADDVNFDVTLAGNTITLGGTQLTISDDVTVTGLGASDLTIDAAGTSRAIIVTNNATADISGLTMTGGSMGRGGGLRNDAGSTTTLTAVVIDGNTATVASFDAGGGIWNAGDLTITDSTISNNSTTAGSSGGVFNKGNLTVTNSTVSGNSAYATGGGIFNYNNGDLTVTDSTVSGNSASGSGGGIWNAGDLTITDSTISNNSTTVGSGGGVFNIGNLTVTDSTVSGNSAYGSGGGIFSNTNSNYVTTVTTITGSTISGNTAVQGGGVYNHHGLTAIRYSTITLNDAGTSGDGVWSFGDSYTRTDVGSSIIAGNVGNDDVHTNGVTNEFVSLGYNLIGGGNDVGAFSATGDQTGVTDPMVGPLADNGGPTQTHALLAGSPAIDAGDPAVVGAPANDQRGYPFVRQNGTIDIGAYEMQSLSLVVDTNVDESDGNYSPGDLSLREALELANANPGADTINFDAALAGSTIYTSLGALSITDDLTLNGLGANVLTIDAQGNSRVMRVAVGATADISGLTLTGGLAPRGGGFRSYNGTTTTLTGVVIQGNTATTTSADSGGGLWTTGAVTVRDSLISGNTANGNGGGAWSNNSLTILSSTISGNTAGTYHNGGGVWAFGSLVIRHSTISGNLAYYGAGINAVGATLDHTIVANNKAAYAYNGDIYGSVIANWSLIEDTTGATIGGANNITGVDPMLGPLADNGGPTQTHALLAGSPAIDAGDPAAVAGVGTVPLYDQRGYPFGRENGTIDIGAYEVQSLSLVVDTNVDESDGDYSPGDLSLREAIELANANPGADIINFDGALAGSTISLTLGQLSISDDVTIIGLGASDLTIDAQGASRVFSVGAGTTDTISGLTLTGGVGNGGGVSNSGDLTVTDSVITGNSASKGGGIFNVGVFSILRSTVSDNYAGQVAGGIYGAFGSGGVTITDSTVSGNSAVSGGGGVWANGSTLSITGTTISGNTAGTYGGGVLSAYNTATITHSTIVDNSAYSGGGVNTNYSSTTTIEHTIVANNTATSVGPDVHGSVTANWSLIEDTTGASFGGANNVTGLDPMLGPLANNGGPTQTHALLAGSPAIDAGDPAVVGAPANDQRGYPFVRQSGTIDIGAYEAQSLSLVVDTNVDESDGDYSPGDLSLREAIELANANPGADTITFDGALAGGTISLALGQLSISDDVTINGLGASDLTVDAQGASRVLSVGAGTTDTISGLTLTGGGSVTRGGGVYNQGNLTITDSVITGNDVGSGGTRGGGIDNRGVLSVQRSTISNNSAGYGAGVAGQNGSGAITITDSTISGNSTTDFGGGGVFANYAPLSITSTTISGNSSATYGGGVVVAHGTATITHSTIVDNTTANYGGGIDSSHAGGATLDHTIVANNSAITHLDIQGPVTANWSLIEDTSGATLSGANNITGVDPLLGPLQDNGGPTQTHALLPGSPAIDAGDPAVVAGVGSVPLYDQRGTGHPRVVGRIDIGAVESLHHLVVDTVADESDGDFSAGDLSLREALELTNANPGADVIEFDPGLAGGSINLVLGQLSISDDVTVNGLGASDLTIDANGNSRVLQITAGTVDISGLTLTGGNADLGGGIRNYGTLSITGSTVSGNMASVYGGGIYNSSGDVTITDSTIAGNSANYSGGGIATRDNLTITNSTISGNSSGLFGGGVYVVNAGDLVSEKTTISGSTISGNSAVDGGGVFNYIGLTEIRYSTITLNDASGDGDGVWSWGYQYSNTRTEITSSIIAGNVGDDDVFTNNASNGFFSGGYNLIGGGNNATAAFVQPGDQTGVTDPMLGPLANNGGPTQTHALLPGSPAIDAGDPAAVAGVGNVPLYDQRDFPLFRQNGTIDIGSYEAQSLSLVVDTAVDESDGDYSVGDLSLREAIELANANPGADTIAFDASLTGSTILLGGTQLEITDDVTVTGLGASDLTVDAGGLSRVLHITNGATVEVSGLTITGGMENYGAGVLTEASTTTTLSAVVIQGNTATASSGGGVFSFGTITVTDSTVTDNVAGSIGGGITISGDNSTIVRSTVSANEGGGVYSGADNVMIVDSTISENTISFYGGGIINAANLTILGSTISGNTASDGGAIYTTFGLLVIEHSTITNNGSGGIYAYSNGTTQIRSSIIAGNTSSQVATTGSAVVQSLGYNLIGDAGGGFFVEPGDQTFTDPMLGPLQDNGGPAQTHALLPGSPAYNAGDPAAVAGVGDVPLYDQRTAPFGRVVGTIDIGSYEAQSLSLVVDTAVDESDGDYSPGDLSLREAIELANANPGADTIDFDGALAGSTISLTLGELGISDDVTVNGLGASDLTVDAGGLSRVIDVNNNATVDISGLTMTGGMTALAGGGIAADTGTDTTLSAVVVQGNTAAKGGGIFTAGTLTITDSTITGNTSSGSIAGGVDIYSSNVSIVRTTISANDGGGVSTIYGNVSITDSTIAGNFNTYQGGGVRSTDSTVTILGSTISGNTASGNGGGIYNRGGPMTIEHSTIANNAVYGYSSGTIQVRSSIIAGATGVTGTAVVQSLGYNLIDNSGGGFFTQTGDLTNTDPLLGPLQDNGGPTFTRALLPGSPAIDAGDPADVAGVGDVPLYDQRGTNYERVQAGRIDIGAYELLLADGNLDGQVDGLDYLLWASNYPDNPAADPPGSPQNGDYNNDGKVDGVDYLLWASQYLEGTPAVAASQPAASTQEQLAAVDTTFANAYSVGATVQDWQVSQAFDAVLKHDTVLKRKGKKDK